MGKLFCIMGKSASGKDTIFGRLTKDSELKLAKIVPYTTRPVRQGEKNGQEYYFVSDEVYERMRLEKKVIESRTYQTVNGPWHYFTADDGQIQLSESSAVMIGTLEVYVQVCAYYGMENVMPVYIEVEDGLRLERALSREKMQQQPNYAEICRRFLADCEDFSEEKLEAAGIRKRYQNVDIDACYDQIYEDIRKITQLNDCMV